MLWPLNPAHNQVKINLWQRIRVPAAGKPFKFTVIPGGSYASVGEIYTCSGYPNNDVWMPKYVSISSKNGSTFDRLSAWEHAEWHYV